MFACRSVSPPTSPLGFLGLLLSVEGLTPTELASRRCQALSRLEVRSLGTSREPQAPSRSSDPALGPGVPVEAANPSNPTLADVPEFMDTDNIQGDEKDLSDGNDFDDYLLDPADILTKMELSSGMCRYFSSQLMTLKRVQVQSEAARNPEKAALQNSARTLVLAPWDLLAAMGTPS